MQRSFIFLSLLWVITAGATNGALGQSDHGKAVSPNTVKWGPAPPIVQKGAQAAVLAGDPTKPRPFNLRLKMPARYKIPAHSHPTYEALTVISGNFNIGMGDKLDEKN